MSKRTRSSTDGATDAASFAIVDVRARQIFDSRGNPTVEVEVALAGAPGVYHRAAVPSGASTGVHEAHELRDGGSRYHGKGVAGAVAAAAGPLRAAVLNKDAREQAAVDAALRAADGDAHLKTLGANAVLGVSMAVARAAAATAGVPLYAHLAALASASTSAYTLPVPAFNCINGGSHSGAGLCMQEFMVLPVGASDFADAMRMGSEFYHHLKKVIKARYGQNATNVGDEGGFAPSIDSNKEALQLLRDAMKAAGLRENDDMIIGMDVAASEFYEESGQVYNLDFKDAKAASPRKLTGAQLAAVYEEFARDFPIGSIEDPFDQDDFASYTSLTKSMGERVQIVGDDLLVTNPERIRRAIKEGACNALLLKVNQIGCVTQSLEAARLAREAGWGVMVSHRSGETEDTFIADLVVAIGSGQIKTGAPCRSERLAKYNQLLRIEEELKRDGVAVKYAGKAYRHPWSSKA